MLFKKKSLKLKSGVLWLYGPGIFMLTIVLSAVTILWIHVSNVKARKLMKTVQSLGEFATTLFISIASPDGSKLDRYVLLIIGIGNFKSMVNEPDKIK